MRMYKHLKLKPGKRSRSSFKNATKKAEKKKERVKALKNKISRITLSKQKNAGNLKKKNRMVQRQLMVIIQTQITLTIIIQ